MKYQIGIISSDYIGSPLIKPDDYESTKLLECVNKSGISTLFIDPSKVVIEILDEEVAIFYTHKLKDGSETLVNLSGLKALLVRRTRGYSEQIYDLISLLDEFSTELNIYDPPSSYDRPLSKITSIQKRFGKFNQARSMILPDNLFPDYFPLDFPLIAKPTHGWRGHGVEECKTTNDLEKYLNNFSSTGDSYGVILQEKIKTSDEYRVFVIGGKAFDAVHKSNREKTPNNRHQGAHFTKRKIKRLDEMKKIAEECVATHNLSVAGVDMTIHDGEIFIIECNRNPEFKGLDKATEKNTAQAILDYIITDADLHKDLEISEISSKYDSITDSFGLIIATNDQIEYLKALDKKLNALEVKINENYSVVDGDIEDIKDALKMDVSTGHIPSKTTNFGPRVSKAVGDFVSKITSGVINKTSDKGIDYLSTLIIDSFK